MFLVSKKEPTENGQSIQKIWTRMSLHERRQALPPALRVQDLTPAERLRGLTPQQLVRNLTERERQALKALLG